MSEKNIWPVLTRKRNVDFRGLTRAENIGPVNIQFKGFPDKAS